MKKIIMSVFINTFASAMLLAIIAVPVFAAAVSWKGTTWDDLWGANLTINGSGNLAVTGGANYGAAHYNTPIALRSTSTPCIEVKFLDQGVEGTQTQLWVEKEGTPNAAWFQFGTWQGNDQYRIYWWNVDTDKYGWYESLGQRSEGEHTLKVGKRTNGVVDFILDGKVVKSTTDIVPAYFGDVYLASKLGISEFTDYRTCTDYQYPTTGVITNPANNSAHVSGNVVLSATYDDGDSVNDDAVQWAVRKGTCAAATNTVFGNVDGHSDPYTWTGSSFTASINTTGLDYGSMYCFVFNPTDDAGQNNVRETREFIVDEPLIGPPIDKNQCKDNGWNTFNNPAFKNQGDCVSYIQSNPNAIGNKTK